MTCRLDWKRQLLVLIVKNLHRGSRSPSYVDVHHLDFVQLLIHEVVRPRDRFPINSPSGLLDRGSSRFNTKPVSWLPQHADGVNHEAERNLFELSQSTCASDQELHKVKRLRPDSISSLHHKHTWKSNWGFRPAGTRRFELGRRKWDEHILIVILGFSKSFAWPAGCLRSWAP